MASFTRDADVSSVGQNHDRIDGLVPPSPAHPHPHAPPSEPVEITAVQKMLSATSGSLVTALLGAFMATPPPPPPLPTGTQTNLSHLSNPP